MCSPRNRSETSRPGSAKKSLNTWAPAWLPRPIGSTDGNASSAVCCFFTPDAIFSRPLPSFGESLPATTGKNPSVEIVFACGLIPSRNSMICFAAARGEQLRLRIYRPRERRGPLPVLVYFHGGGFVTGGLDANDEVCAALRRAFADAMLG